MTNAKVACNNAAETAKTCIASIHEQEKDAWQSAKLERAYDTRAVGVEQGTGRGHADRDQEAADKEVARFADDRGLDIRQQEEMALTRIKKHVALE